VIFNLGKKVLVRIPHHRYGSLRLPKVSRLAKPIPPTLFHHLFLLPLLSLLYQLYVFAAFLVLLNSFDFFADDGAQRVLEGRVQFLQALVFYHRLEQAFYVLILTESRIRRYERRFSLLHLRSCAARCRSYHRCALQTLSVYQFVEFFDIEYLLFHDSFGNLVRKEFVFD